MSEDEKRLLGPDGKEINPKSDNYRRTLIGFARTRTLSLRFQIPTDPTPTGRRRLHLECSAAWRCGLESASSVRTTATDARL